ncbi:MAG TPA: hypothetical protein VH328_13575, partial [Burkholderiaceae bacterium]|nr:hypothetical protein [Burkholderiaceae bacterium]
QQFQHCHANCTVAAHNSNLLHSASLLGRFGPIPRLVAKTPADRTEALPVVPHAMPSATGLGLRTDSSVNTASAAHIKAKASIFSGGTDS